jgi:predicted acetyltransferase
MRPVTRMQVRVLDHAKLLESMRLPPAVRGEAVVAVHETEGHVSKFRIAMCDGQAEAYPTDATADVECRDSTWAAVVLGDLPARQASSLGLLATPQCRAHEVLDAFSVGPAPFCEEYF